MIFFILSFVKVNRSTSKFEQHQENEHEEVEEVVSEEYLSFLRW